MKSSVIRGIVSVILALSLIVPMVMVSSDVTQAAAPAISKGDRVAVTAAGGSAGTGGLPIYWSYTTGSGIKGYMPAGDEGEALLGPWYSEGRTWWYINWRNGDYGCSYDASAGGGVDYLRPLPGKGVYPDVTNNGLSYRVCVYADGSPPDLAVRSGHHTSEPVLTRKAAGSRGWTLGAPYVSTLEELVWWYIKWDDGVFEGWSADSRVGYQAGVYLVKEGSIGPIGPVSVATYSATDKGQTQASLRGAITNFNHNPSGCIRFWYRPSGGSWTHTSWVYRTSTSTYSEPVYGLSPGTDYEFYAQGYGSVDTTEKTGTIEYFTTLGPQPVPEPVSVATYSQTDVGQTQATLWGAITDFKNNPAGYIRFLYRSAGGSWSSTSWVYRTSTASYSKLVDDLNPGTDYEFYAQGYGSVDTTLSPGDILTFKTDDQEPVISARIDNYSPSTKITVTAGTSFHLKVWFTNTGDAGYFYPGVSIWDSPPGTPGREEEFGGYGSRTYLAEWAQETGEWNPTIDTPGEYWLRFGIWDDTKTSLLCTAPSLSANLIVVVEPIERYLLTVAWTPPDGGTVTPNPEADTDGKYAAGTVVTLRASPAPGYDFDYWTGTDNNNVNPTTVTVDSDKGIIAWFTEQKPDLAVEIVSTDSFVIEEKVSIIIKIANKGKAPIPAKRHTINVYLIDYKDKEPSSWRVDDSFWAFLHGKDSRCVYSAEVDLPEIPPNYFQERQLEFQIPGFGFPMEYVFKGGNPVIWTDTLNVDVQQSAPKLYEDANPSNNVVEQDITVSPSIFDVANCVTLFALPVLIKYKGAKIGIEIYGHMTATTSFFSFAKNLCQQNWESAVDDLADIILWAAETVGEDAAALVLGLVRDLLEGYTSCEHLFQFVVQFAQACTNKGINLAWNWVRCPVDILIVDEHGNRAGYAGGTVYKEIEGSDVVVVDDQKLVLVPGKSGYTVTLTGTDVGTMDFKMILPAGEGFVRIVEYDAVPVSQSTVAIVGTDSENPEYSMAIDNDGDGQLDEERYPDLVNISPNTPSNPSPTDNATGIPTSPDLAWIGGDPDAGDTVTYDVYLDTAGAMNLVSDNQSAITYDPGTLSYNITYYWKIVARDNHGVTTEGSVWNFTTGPIVVNIDAPDEVAEGGDFAADVAVDHVEDFDSCGFDVIYDETIITVTDVTGGEIGGHTIEVGPGDWTYIPPGPDPGRIRVSASVAGAPAPGVTGTGYIAQIHYRVLGSVCSTSIIRLENLAMYDCQAQTIDTTAVDDSVHVAFPSLEITTTGLPDGAVGDIYSATLGATGGKTPYTWNATGLPPGLACSAAGVISGTPVGGVGDFPVAVHVIDDLGNYNNENLSLTISCKPGDANMDGVVDTGDITKLKRIYFGLDPATPCADVNGDGSIDTGDITAIKVIYFGT